jgi:hypothetical protein
MNTVTGFKSSQTFGTSLLAESNSEMSECTECFFQQPNFWEEQCYALTKAKKPTRKNVSKPSKVENKKTLA